MLFFKQVLEKKTQLLQGQTIQFSVDKKTETLHPPDFKDITVFFFNRRLITSLKYIIKEDNEKKGLIFKSGAKRVED